MRSILTKLYFGEINPSYRTLQNAHSYKQKVREVAKREEELCQTLSKEQIERYETLMACRSTIETMETLEQFRYGFRLGLLMALESCQSSDTLRGDVVL